jgi:hypothetical protein
MTLNAFFLFSMNSPCLLGGLGGTPFVPYAIAEPHLIEILWRFIKYQGLEPKDYESLDTLFAAVESILRNYGTDYAIISEGSAQGKLKRRVFQPDTILVSVGLLTFKFL